MARFDEIEAEFHHIMDELKRVSDFSRQALVVASHARAVQGSRRIHDYSRAGISRKVGKPPQV